MAMNVRRVDYFYTTVTDQPGESYKLLSHLADLGVNLLAFTAVPTGMTQTQLTIFPEDSGKLMSEARKAVMELDGPHPAFFAQGDDSLGALAPLHRKLYEANVNVYASSGTADGKGSYGYVIYVRPDEFEEAAQALGL